MTDILRLIASIVSPFCSDTYMSTNDCIFVIVVTILALIGFILNLLLLYLIAYRSPASLTPYKVFLANTTLTQLFYAIATIFSQPRVLTKNEYTIVIYLGPVQLFGEWMSYMSYILILHYSLNSFISLMLSMIYRYYSIRRGRFSMKTSISICIAGYLLPLGLLLSCCNIIVRKDVHLNQELLTGIVDNVFEYQMVLSTNIKKQPALVILVFFVTLGLVPIYLVMYWCRWQIHKKLKMTSNIQSNTTKDNARRLVFALTIQSIIPLISIFPASIFWSLSQAGIVGPEVYSYFVVPSITVACIADPIVTLSCVLPYRRWVLRTLRVGNSEMTMTSVPERSEKSHIQKRLFTTTISK